MKKKPANEIQDLQYFGEFGGVNPSISDSSTYTFLSAKSMSDTFEVNSEGCYLYSRHTSPSNLYLGEALAAMENTESATVFGSGMGAIDTGDLKKANSMMELMQQKNVGYLAVSLGFYKTLFSTPGSSTSSEIPEEEQKQMGLNEGLIRFSIGLDNDIKRSYDIIKECMKEIKLI